ncbi:MAG: hypothetical protein V2I43_12415 [Parvularcula sp.]|jgi:hypothetical protein|nr:hypothetical protein [Parvularcula sp.]
MRDILRSVLLSAARNGRTLTYAKLAKQLALQPPHTIHRTGLLLEDLMRDQAAKDEPQLASFVVSKARAGLPAPGFFMMMRELGFYDGSDMGADAQDLVENERARCAQLL